MIHRTLTTKVLPALAFCTVCVSCGGGGAAGPGVDGAAPPAPDAEAIDRAPVVDALADDAASDTPADAEETDGDATAELLVDSAPNCAIMHTPSTLARAAHSAGYSGSDSAYYALYGASCQLARDCVSACAAAGGLTASCVNGSQCLPGVRADGGAGCVPPPVWLTVDGALSESGMTTNAAQLVMVSVPYDDPLVLTDFRLSIPDDATITGIQFDVRRATLSGDAADETVQIVRGGSPVGTNHAKGAQWPTALTVASYGGTHDTWDVPWSVSDATAPGFGISIAPKYTGPTSGNEHAYVDSVRVTVFYTGPCD